MLVPWSGSGRLLGWEQSRTEHGISCDFSALNKSVAYQKHPIAGSQPTALE